MVRSRVERRLIAAIAVVLAVYNGLLSMFRAPLAGFGQFDDVVSPDLLRGSHFLLLLSGLTLLLVAPGLWHGKRFAWLLAVIAAIVSVVAHPLRNLDLLGMAGSMLFLGLLIGARPEFPGRSDPPTTRRGFLTLLVGIAAVYLYAVLGLYLLDTEFLEPISLASALQDGLRLMFVLPSIDSHPVSHHAAAFIDSIRVSIVCVWVLGAIQVLRPVIHRHSTMPHEREEVRHLLEQHATSALSFFSLLPDKSYFFSDNRQAVLAYGVAGDTAIVMGDPLGDASEFPRLVSAFQEHCELNGWAYAFNQAQPQFLTLYRGRGLKALKTGEEGVVDVQGFRLAGNAHKHLRATMNRFEREGFRAEVWQPPHDREALSALGEISNTWLEQGQRRERGFMLGYFDEELLQQCNVMVALDTAGTPVAFANILPAYRSTEATFDMLRYGAEPKDVADFLYVSMIQYFRELGFQTMNLGLAPFSGLNQESDGSPAGMAMRLIYRYGAFLLRYQGLRGFKEKYATAWEPRYLVYRDDGQLPGIALATVRLAEKGAGKGSLPKTEHSDWDGTAALDLTTAGH